MGSRAKVFSLLVDTLQHTILLVPSTTRCMPAVTFLTVSDTSAMPIHDFKKDRKSEKQIMTTYRPSQKVNLKCWSRLMYKMNMIFALDRFKRVLKTTQNSNWNVYKMIRQVQLFCPVAWRCLPGGTIRSVIKIEVKLLAQMLPSHVTFPAPELTAAQACMCARVCQGRNRFPSHWALY